MRNTIRLAVLSSLLAIGMGCNVPNVSSTRVASALTRIASVSNSKAPPVSIPSPVVTASPGVILVPGAGFSGPMQQPAQVGSGAAADEMAIARWDAVPFQTFNGFLNLGVVAFHVNGIDHVEFRVDGGAPANIAAMTLNGASGVEEYWVSLDAKLFQKDGPVEVRAIAYPKVGVPRVLEPLPLNANAKGTLPALVRYVGQNGDDSTGDGSILKPFATTNMAAFSIQTAQGSTDGATIYLLPGSYQITSALWWSQSSNTNQWLTVTAAPGVSRDQVVITGTQAAGFNTKLLKFENVTITGTIDTGGGSVTSYFWANQVLFQGSDRTDGVAGTSPFFNGGKYITDSMIQDNADGARDYTLVRNVVCARIGGDAFSGSVAVLNSSISYLGQQPNDVNFPEFHSDIWQFVGGANNAIMYGLTATDHMGLTQAFQFNQPPSGVAIVNANVDLDKHWVLDWSYENIFVKNSSVFAVMGDNISAKNVVFDHVTFPQFPGDRPGVSYR